MKPNSIKMGNKKSGLKKAYSSVNKMYGIENPAFSLYLEFKKEVIRRSFRYGT